MPDSADQSNPRSHTPQGDPETVRGEPDLPMFDLPVPGLPEEEDHQHKKGEEFENFRLISPLGKRGGQGEVWKARHVANNAELVALKIYAGTDADAQKCSGREQAALGRRLSGMPRAKSNGVASDGRPWLAMDFINGVTITEYAQVHKLGLASRLKLVINTANHLAEAHTEGLLHRDIHAGNILVSGGPDSPEVWIIDWGLASNTDDRDIAANNATLVGHFTGTPEYCAPEVLHSGLTRTTPRSDVLALGIVLHELVTGVGLFDAPSAAGDRMDAARQFWAKEHHPKPIDRLRMAREQLRIARKQLRIARERQHIDITGEIEPAERSAWEAALTGPLARVLRCATHEDLARRYRDLAEFRHDLEHVLERVGAKPAADPDRTLRCDQLLGAGDPWLRAAYRSRVANDAALYAGAAALIELGDHARARRLLGLVSPGSRQGWEYGYLSARAEPSLFVIGGD